MRRRHLLSLCLSRAKGEFVRVLDSDDLLLPEALAAAIQAFELQPEIHWVASQADDLLPDGQRLAHPLPIEPGLIAPGIVTDYICLGGTPPIPLHPAGLTIRTTTALALGGWGGFPILPAVNWLYRKHPDQITTPADDLRFWQDNSRLTTAQRIAAKTEIEFPDGFPRPAHRPTMSRAGRQTKRGCRPSPRPPQAGWGDARRGIRTARPDSAAGGGR